MTTAPPCSRSSQCHSRSPSKQTNQQPLSTNTANQNRATIHTEQDDEEERFKQRREREKLERERGSWEKWRRKGKGTKKRRRGKRKEGQIQSTKNTFGVFVFLPFFNFNFNLFIFFCCWLNGLAWLVWLSFQVLISVFASVQCVCSQLSTSEWAPPSAQHGHTPQIFKNDKIN